MTKHTAYIISLLCSSAAAFTSVAQVVTPGTGDLMIVEPFITIPTVNGPDVTVSAEYNSGIEVNQSASEIGLGWTLKYGSRIDRAVNGVPDDWDQILTYSPSEDDFSHLSGFLKACGNSSATTTDFFQSEEAEETYYRIAKDRYFISGSALEGSITPYIFEYKPTYVDENAHDFDMSAYTSKPEFIMNGSFNGDMESTNYFPWADAPVDNAAEVLLPGAPNSFSGDEYHSTTGVSRPVTSYYVEYFTNAEVRAKVTNSVYEFFLEPQEDMKRNSPNYDGIHDELIGAFRITDPAGFVYHYSLPVYLNYSTYGQYPLNSDYTSVVTSEQNLTREDRHGSYVIRENTTNMVVEYRQAAKYAITWYLTAVTGPDFKDVNQNHLIDEKDEGYWVKYNYEKVQHGFSHREPLLGHDVNYVGKSEGTDFTGYVGSFRSTDVEVYLLKSIETQDYVALNIWDVRLDEHGSIDHDIYDPQIKVETNIGSNGNSYNMSAIDGYSSTVNDFKGVLFDDGGENYDYNLVGTSSFVIDPPGATKVTLDFDDLFNVSSSINNHLNPIYEPTLSPWHCDWFTSSGLSTCHYFYNPNASCAKQWLTFHDGPSSASPVITIDGNQNFCGTQDGDLVPTTITSSESSTGDAAITVVMNVEGYGNYPSGGIGSMLSDHEFGFRAKWRAEGYYHAFQEHWKGTLYDDGGASGNYDNDREYTYTIRPENADGVKFMINSAAIQSGDDFIIYNGSSTSGTVLFDASVTSSFPTSWIASTSDAVTVYFNSNSSGNAAGFELEWEALWNHRFPVDPGFKLSKVLLMHRKDFEGQDFVTAFAANALPFRMNNIVNQGKSIYNSDWFDFYETQIKASTLYAVEFDQDYSLAKNYINNINVYADNTTKLDNISDVMVAVANDDMTNSGKLSLNTIRRLGRGYVQTEPSRLFEYDLGSSNPNYDARKVDSWGYYKSDALDGYSKYRTTSSSSGADAWSLKKIVLALGGEIEINYESDQVYGVLQDDMSSGLAPVGRLYHITNASVGTTLGSDWTLTFDEAATELSSVLSTSGNTVTFHIPFECGTYEYFAFGSGTVTATGTPGEYTVTGLSVFNKTLSADLGTSSYSCTPIEQSPGAYVYIELDPSNSYAEGGIRVSSIERSLSVSHGYTESYTYEKGVSAPLPDRAARPELETMGSYQMYDDLEPYANFELQIGPEVVYDKVTVTKEGRNNNSEGYVKYDFITAPESDEIIYATVQKDQSEMHTAFDFTWSFPQRFGLQHSLEVYDKNNLLVSKQVNEYEDYELGALTDIVDVVTLVYPSAGGIATNPDEFSDIVIFRPANVRLKYQHNFDQSLKTTTEVMAWDPINGMTNQKKVTTGEHEQVTYEVYAFHQSPYTNMGPKCINEIYSNQLLSKSEQWVQIDATALSTSDFAVRTASVFRDDFEVRKLSQSTCAYVENTELEYFHRDGPTHIWNGTLGDYGIFASSAFVAFDFSETSIDQDWKKGEEPILYDSRGNILSTIDRFGDYTSTRYVFDQRTAYMSIGNASYQSATASGFEELLTVSNASETGTGTGGYGILSVTCDHAFFEGEVDPGNYFSIVDNSHTGEQAMMLQPGAASTYTASCASGSESDLEAGRRYRASVWVSSTSASDTELRIDLNGTLAGSGYTASANVLKGASTNVQVGAWVQMNVEIEVPEGFSTSAGGYVKVQMISASESASIFDDFRFHPVESEMKVLVFDESTGLVVGLLDEQNFATFFTYDSRGDLVKKEVEVIGEGVVKTFESNSHYYRGLNN